nr:LysR substrate-binding domain-containing protein [Morganella morganii]
MTLAHRGYSLLPVWYIRELLADEKLVPVFAHQPVPDQSINMVFPPAAHLPQKTRVFIDYFARFFAGNTALLRYP